MSAGQGVVAAGEGVGGWGREKGNAKEAIGKVWSKFFHIAGVPGR